VGPHVQGPHYKLIVFMQGPRAGPTLQVTISYAGPHVQGPHCNLLLVSKAPYEGPTLQVTLSLAGPHVHSNNYNCSITMVVLSINYI